MYWLVSLSGAPAVGGTMFALDWKALSAGRASSSSLRNASSGGESRRAVWSASAAFMATVPSIVAARNALAISDAWLGSLDLYLIVRTFVPKTNFGSTLLIRPAAIQSSMLSRPKEDDFLKFA